MRILQILSLFFLLAIWGCNPSLKQVNHFNVSSDTLIIQTEKIKGYGMFPGGGGDINFRDTTEYYKYQVIFPKNLTNIKLSHEIIDSKKYDSEVANKNSWNNSIFKENSICIMSGNIGNDTVFIVDEDNNKDFRNDSIRLTHDYDWNKPAKLIKIKYKIFNGKEMAEDYGWATIRTRSNNQFVFFVSHHLESTFFIDNQIYQIGAVSGPPYIGFCYDSPILALTAQNGIKKDTLYESDLLQKGEYLKLKDKYYRFVEISNDGKFITLIKENDFDSKIGTQVGMIAPDFNCKSVDGDSIRFKDYKGKYLLLINVTGCWSPISSYKTCMDLTEAYKGKIDLIGIDNSPVFLKNNLKELRLSGNFIDASANKTIQVYRPLFCSRTCFLINPSGRIADKFEIFDWKSKLEQSLGKSKPASAVSPNKRKILLKT